MSADYQLKSNGYVFRNRDGGWIPPVNDNADWKEYQEWLAAGHTPDPVDPPPG